MRHKFNLWLMRSWNLLIFLQKTSMAIMLLRLGFFLNCNACGFHSVNFENLILPV